MARVEKYQETPPDDGVIVHQSVPPIPVIMGFMGFPHLSKGLDGFLIGDLDRTAREVAESMAAPVEIDLAMPVDLGLDGFLIMEMTAPVPLAMAFAISTGEPCPKKHLATFCNGPL